VLNLICRHSAAEDGGRIVIGHTTDRSVRIWVQGTRRYPRVRVSVQPAGQLQTGRIPSHDRRVSENRDYTTCVEFLDLAPSSTYEVTASFTGWAIGRSKSLVVRGVFKTFPRSEAAEPFSFLLGSCNLPVVAINNLAAQALQVVGFHIARQSLKRPIPQRRPQSAPGERLYIHLGRWLMRRRWGRWLLGRVILISLALVFLGTGGKWSMQPLLKSPFLKLAGMFASRRVDFRSGRAAPAVGETLIGRDSQASGVVVFDPVVNEGSWKGKDAQGFMILTDTSREFRRGEGLRIDGEPNDVIAQVSDSSGFEMPDLRRPAFMIHAGDVIYFDFPKSSRKPQLDSYRDEYRESWFEDRFQRWFLAHGPHYMTLDDHEIVDQFACDELGGSDEVTTAGRAEAGRKAQQFLAAARPAYVEYVHSRHPDPDGPLFYDFCHGMVPFFVMDTRTGRRRRSDSQIIDGAQMETFKRWLKKHKEHLKFVVSSVPFVAELARSGDSSEVDDKWCGRPFRWQRDEIIDFIEDEAIERVVFLVGDMHCAYHASLSIGNGHRWMRRTIHELAGGPINQLDLSGRAQFTDASLITRGDQNPYQVRMHQFHGNASAVMHVEVTTAKDPPDTEVPEIIWRVIRTMTDPESRRDVSNGPMRIEDPPAISGRITFRKKRGIGDLPEWRKEDP
jgi:hypothetical protein